MLVADVEVQPHDGWVRLKPDFDVNLCASNWIADVGDGATQLTLRIIGE